MTKNVKLNKFGEIYWFLGSLLIALGVTICKKADLGVSMINAPAFIIYEAIEGKVSFLSVGVIEYAIQALCAILLCIVVGKIKLSYVLSILVGIFYGYVLDLWLIILGPKPFEQVWLRYLMLVVGNVITSSGVACFFRTYLPLQSYDIFVKDVSLKYNLNMNIFKYIYDATLFVISVVLAISLFGDVASFDWSEIYKTSYHTLGLGTLVSAVMNAPTIALVGKLLDKVFGTEALIPKLKLFFEKK